MLTCVDFLWLLFAFGSGLGVKLLGQPPLIGFLAAGFLLNFAGVLPGRRLVSWWRWIVIIVLVFAAVATPTGDPINLMLLAGPIFVLVAIAVAVALLNDRRRARRRTGPELRYRSWAFRRRGPIPCPTGA